MDGKGKNTETNTSPTATYTPIPEKDMEDTAVSQSKKVYKVKTGDKSDGADERMLPNEDKKAVIVPVEKLSPNEKQNGEAKLDICEPKSTFGGMGKEELMKYANDPFWIRLRWFLFIGFWVLWAAMLIGAVLIIYAAPKCNPPPPRTWWQEGPLAELTADTDPDHIKSLDTKIKAVIIPVLDDAYVSLNNTHNIMKLIVELKDVDIKTIIDLDPSSSTKWFEDSQYGNESYLDYYMWKPAKGTGSGGLLEPPNNWISASNKSSWTYSENRKQFYYSPLGKPHLNFRNDSVVEEFSKVIRNFLNLGAAGIRIRNAPLLLTDPKFENENSISQAAGLDHKQYGFYTHSKTENVPDLGVLLKKWRHVVRNVTENGPFMVSDELTKIQSYKVNDTLVVDLPLKSHVFNKTNLSDIVNNLNHTFNIDNIEWPLWKVANSTSFPSDVLDYVTYLLPGATLVDADASIDHQILKIRQSPSIMRGICKIHSINNNTVLAFIRVTSGNPGILVALNTKNYKVTVNFPESIPALSDLGELTIQLYSKNYNETDFMTINAKKPAKEVPLSPKSVLVMSYVPKKNGQA